MNLIGLREKLKLYRSRLEVFYLAENLNQKPSLSLEEIEDEASDLFAFSAVESLKNLLDSSSDAAETERDARRNLLQIARFGFVKNQTKEISSEIEICRRAARVKFENETLDETQILEKIESENSAARRSEISARFVESQNALADLRAERRAQMQEKIAVLGFSDYAAFVADVTEIDFADFARKAQSFLEQTEKVYFQLLSETAQGNGLDEKSPRAADVLFLRKQIDRKDVFAARNLARLYEKILENFDFSKYKIPQIKTIGVSEKSRTRVFRVNVPEDARFCIANRDGVENCERFLFEFGKANQAAWTSKDLAKRYPEFVFSPDDVLRSGYGFLFQTMFFEKAFLQKTLGVRDEKTAAQIRRERLFSHLFDIRREITRFILEARVFSEKLNPDETSEKFAEIFSNNLGFRFDERQIFLEISDSFSSLKNLRARLFAAGLREYLREKYGFDWREKRRAFEELIDFWNAAERYKTEEMARKIGFEMNFDLLAEDFKLKK